MARVAETPWLAQGHCNLPNCVDWHQYEAKHPIELVGRGVAVWVCSFVVEFWPEIEPERHAVKFVAHDRHPRRRCYRLTRAGGDWSWNIKGLAGVPCFTKKAQSIPMLNSMLRFINNAWSEHAYNQHIYITIDIKEIGR